MSQKTVANRSVNKINSSKIQCSKANTVPNSILVTRSAIYVHEGIVLETKIIFTISLLVSYPVKRKLFTTCVILIDKTISMLLYFIRSERFGMENNTLVLQLIRAMLGYILPVELLEAQRIRALGQCSPVGISLFI